MERETTDHELLKSSKRQPSSFFKIMIGDFKNVLLIPPQFAHTVRSLVKKTVFLRDSNGQSWRVKLFAINDQLAFQEGWHDFVLDHFITVGELVVFKYIGPAAFEVDIYGTSCCNRTNFDEESQKSSTGLKRKAMEVRHESIQSSKKQKTSDVPEHRIKTTKSPNENIHSSEKQKAADVTEYRRKAIEAGHEHINFSIKQETSDVSECRRKAIDSSHENLHLSEKQKTDDVFEHRRKVTESHHDDHFTEKQETADGSDYKFEVGSCYSRMKLKKEKLEKEVPTKLKRASGHVSKFGMQPKPFTSNYTRAPKYLIDEDTGEDVATMAPSVPPFETPYDMVKKERETKANVNDLYGPKLPHLPRSYSLERRTCLIGEETGEDVVTMAPSVPPSETPYDKVRKEREKKASINDLCAPKLPHLPGSHSLEQRHYENGMEDLIVAEEPVRRFLITEDGVCHIVDENSRNEVGAKILTSNETIPVENVPDFPCTKEIIDLTNKEGIKCRSVSKKISKKPGDKGITPFRISSLHNAPLASTGGCAPPDKRIQNLQKLSHDMKIYSRRHGRPPKERKEEFKSLLKGKAIQAKVESRDEKKAIHAKIESMDEENLGLPAFAGFKFSLSLIAQTTWVAFPGRLPSQFGKPGHSRKMIVLRDQCRRLWPVLYYEDLKFAGLIGGWEHFVIANKLKEGNLCEFKIALESDNMLDVQISRV